MSAHPLLNSLSNSISVAARFLVSGLTCVLTTLLILVGETNGTVPVPILEIDVSASLAGDVLLLMSFGFGVSYLIVITRALQAMRRLEFELDHVRTEIEDILSGAHWLITTDLLRCLLEMQIAVLSFVLATASFGSMLAGAVVAAPYLVASSRLSPAYLSPSVTLRRRAVIKYFVRAVVKFLQDHNRLRIYPSPLEDLRIKKWLEEKVDEAFREWGFILGLFWIFMKADWTVPQFEPRE